MSEHENPNNNGNSNNDAGIPEDDPKMRVPELVEGRAGRMVSVGGLIERIIEQFTNEFGSDTSQIIATTTETERRGMVRDVASYIFGIESVQLALPQQARIIQHAYGDLFSYGGLDVLFEDEQITTIAIEGPEKIAVRYGPGHDLTPLDPVFDDNPHLRRILKRLLRNAQAELRNDNPIIEVGLAIADRPVCVSLAMPPFTPELTADIRVHPAQPVTLAQLVESNFMPQNAADALQAIAKSSHGFMVVGDTESGKTTLLSALLAFVPDGDNLVTVERAGELRLPSGAQRRIVQWPVDNPSQDEITFGEQITHALTSEPRCIVLDEVRSDEPQSIAPLLEHEHTPRQIWSFRGSSDPMRIRSALGMVARRSNPGAPEAMVYALYERLPFIVIVKRRRGYLQLLEIAEWQMTGDDTYANYTALMTRYGDTVVATDKQPQRALDLPDTFWQAPDGE